MTALLQVFLQDVAIGTLTMLPSGKTFFSFNETYLQDPDRQVLSQSFFRASGELIPETKASSVKLPAFFSNLLPEGHMRNYLAQVGNVKPTAEFKLIELLGEDLPGAVTVVPMGGAGGLSQEPAEAKQGESKSAYRVSVTAISRIWSGP